jgi:hypothetical protein
MLSPGGPHPSPQTGPDRQTGEEIRSLTPGGGEGEGGGRGERLRREGS